MFFPQESEGLTPVPSGSSGPRRKNKFLKKASSGEGSVIGSSSSSCGTCFLILLSFACIATLSYLFHRQLQTLSAEIHADEIQIVALQSKVKQQQTVIDRFSTAVTNQDVIRRVDSLQTSLDTQMNQVQQELNSTQQYIATLLDTTLEQMTQTVTQAQTQITTQVSSIKTQVDAYVRTTQDQFSMENSFMVYQLAGTFTLLAGLISMWHITAHLRRFARPFVQRKILAILWMSPVYGITSWLSLVFPQFHEYLALIKDCYEAYVIYQFLGFLIAVLGGPAGDRHTVVDLLARHAHHLEPPMQCCGWFRKRRGREFWNQCSPTVLADQVLMQCQVFAMQFVFLKPLTVLVLFLLNKFQYYGPIPGVTSTRDYRSPQFWIILLENASVFTAFSGLLKFYHAVQEDLEWCRPFPKFLCIKGIVFMTFWQGLVISILANTALLGGMAPPGIGSSSGAKNGDDVDDPSLWGQQAQNFLICLEMLFFSVAHFNCFPTDEWQDGYRPVKDKDIKFGDNIALRDFFDDLKLILKKGNTSNAHLAKLEEKYEGIINQSSSTYPTKSVHKDNIQGVTNRKSRRHAVSTIQSLALFSPQLILETEEEEDTTDTEQRNVDDLAVTNSDNIEEDEDEEANPIDINESSSGLNGGVTERDTRRHDGPSVDHKNMSSQPLHTSSSSSYYGTPIFLDPETPQQPQHKDLYGSTTMDGGHLGEVSWSHPADETTRLLGFGDNQSNSDSLLGSRNGEEILRPSIFTSLGAHNKFT